MKHKLKQIFTIYLIVFSFFSAFAQQEGSYEKQIWTMGFFNWKLNENWVFNQDVGIMHSLEQPGSTRIFLRPQINRQFTGLLSAHGGLIFIYKFIEEANNAYDINPWLGGKLRWPYFWRFTFVQYLRLEQRFRHEVGIRDWDNNFRFRYKIGASVPINHVSLSNDTFYGVISYEYFSQSFGDDVGDLIDDLHRFDLGLGYRFNIGNRVEATATNFYGKDEIEEQYDLSSLVVFLKYKKYFNWN